MTSIPATAAPVNLTGLDLVADPTVIGKILTVDDGESRFHAGRIVDTMIDDFSPIAVLEIRGIDTRVRLAAHEIAYLAR